MSGQGNGSPESAVEVYYARIYDDGRQSMLAPEMPKGYMIPDASGTLGEMPRGDMIADAPGTLGEMPRGDMM